MNQIIIPTAGRSKNFCGDAISHIERMQDESVRLVVTSPPYNIGKEYEKSDRFSLQEYDDFIGTTISLLAKKMLDGGSICWQVGTNVKNGEILPLDYLSYKHFSKAGLKLRNRIVWRFNFGLNSRNRFSGRYETILWLTKGDDYVFNLDPIRIPQKYPGKRHSSSRRDKPGELSGIRLPCTSRQYLHQLSYPLVMN
jgi:adenine-specific DNA-methyltransferase